jgi:DNA-binding beta-propeller fold protein YncE
MTGSDRDSAGRSPDGGRDSPGEQEQDASVDRPRAEGDHRRVRAGMTGRTRIARRSVVLLCLLVGGLVLWSSTSAMALIHRGHKFSFAIEPKGAEKLAKPKGVAVNQSTGDVYVVDAGHNRVERFHQEEDPETKLKTAKFVEAWGWGVSDGKAEYEVCTSACEKEGIAGTGAAQFNAPEAIAVDNSAGPSSGDVYVLSDTVFPNVAIEKFSATGTPLGRVTTSKSSGKLGGVAVDSSGALWVYDSEGEEIEGYDNAVTNAFLSGINIASGAGVGCEATGFAVDSTGEAFYTGHEHENFEEECPEKPPSEGNPFVIAKLHRVGEPPVAEPLIQELDSQNSSAVAVDLSTGQQASGDVYVDNVTNVAAFTEGGALIQRFGSEAELTKGSGLAVDPQRGEVLVADASTKNRIDVFTLAPEGPPMVGSVSSQNISTTETRLEAQIDANGFDTHYYFQYGTDEVCGQSPSSSCTAVPVPPEDIGSGFGDVHVEQTVAGLQSGTTYFFRVIAENNKGEKAEGAQAANTFTTLPNPVGLLPDGRAWELVSPPDKGGSGIEAIGGSGGPAGGIMESSEDGNAITYVADGPIEREPEGSRSPEGTQVISARSSDAWSSKSIVTPNRQGEGLPAGLAQEYQLFSADLRYALVEPYGQTTLQEPPLAGLEPEERGIYRRSNATCQATPATCYQPIVTADNNLTGEKFGGRVGVVAGDGVLSGTSDLKHVVFQSEVALTEPKPKSEAVNRLYEWSEASAPGEQLKLVSVLPTGKPAPNPKLGTALGEPGAVARNAISANGARVFWTQTEEGPEFNITSLYVRDTTKGETLKLNLPASEVKLSKAGKEIEEAHYQIASSDGSRVFFTDTAALTADSRLKPVREGPADLYVCDLVENEEGKLHCNLTDLSVDPRSEFGESADVAGRVLGISEQGSSVYFVANGVLSEDAVSHGAKPGSCARPTGGVGDPKAQCNLYLERYNGEGWEEPRFVAALSQEDAPDWGGGGGGSLGNMTSRVSPNGRFVAFMSNRSLTGYNNVDASSAAEGARDEEVFLYDATTQRLVCASCNPSGAQPHGVQDTERSGEGLGLLVDRPGIWRESIGGRWLAGSIPGWTPIEPNTAPYQSRYLSDEGRLFFNGADALVPEDKNSKEDVYQYEPAGVGSCEDSVRGCVALLSSGISSHESAFLDASTSGNDVFFVTAGQLVATDRDQSFDVYDARVCTDSSPCVKVPPPPPAPCSREETCRPPAPAQPGFEAPASATFVGPGNIAKQETLGTTKTGTSKPLTKAQKLAKALTSCRTKFKHAKKKRAACEKQARKKYGAKKAAKHKTGKKK